jgi:hypothetical protein
MYSKLLTELCREDLGRVRTYLGLIKDSRARAQALSAIVEEWRLRSPNTLAEAAFSQLKGAERNQALSTSVVGFLDQGNVAAAASLLERMPFSTARTWTLGRVAAGGAKQDLDGTLAWVAKLPSSDERLAAYQQLLPEVASQRGAEALLAVLPMLESDNLRTAYISAAVEALLKEHDALDVRDWIGKSLAGRERDQATAALIKGLPVSQVKEWIPTIISMESEMERTSAIGIAANKLVEKDPLDAGKWALSLPRPIREAAVRQVATDWSSVDPAALFAWIETIGDTTSKDEALFTMAITLHMTSLATARAAADAIANPEKRQLARQFFPKVE